MVSLLTDEQRMLQDSLNRYLQHNYSFDQRKSSLNSPTGYSEIHWKQFAEMGLLALTYPGNRGGFDGGALDTVIVHEALGKSLVVEPIIPCVILAGRLLQFLDKVGTFDEQLGKVMSGEAQLALAHFERGSGDNPAYVSCGAKRDSTSFIVNGEKTLVLNGENAESLIVSARSEGGTHDREGIELFFLPVDTAGVTIRGYTTIDGIRTADVVFENVKIDVSYRLGDPSTNIEALEAVIDEAILASSAQAIGAMSVLTHDTVEYAKTRQQFGVPIGKFQALQFRMVDMWVAQQQCESALFRTAGIQEQGSSIARKAISGLKVMVSRASRLIGEEAIQIHGGIGTTDELRVGHYFKRLLCIEASFGNLDYHLDRYVSLMDRVAV